MPNNRWRQLARLRDNPKYIRNKLGSSGSVMFNRWGKSESTYYLFNRAYNPRYLYRKRIKAWVVSRGEVKEIGYYI